MVLLPTKSSLQTSARHTIRTMKSSKIILLHFINLIFIIKIYTPRLVFLPDGVLHGDSRFILYSIAPLRMSIQSFISFAFVFFQIVL
jgi:hypothetical protein